MTQRKIALSIEEAADYTGIGRNTLRKLVEWKKLPVLKVGRKVLIKTDMLELFMEANEGRDLRDIRSKERSWKLRPGPASALGPWPTITKDKRKNKYKTADMQRFIRL